MSPSAFRVGVLGHYGNDNLGDEAITQAVIENMRRRVPGVDIVCFSANPANTAWRHGVVSYPLSRRAQVLAARWSRAHVSNAAAAAPSASGSASGASPAHGVKAWLKSLPGLRPAVQAARTLLALPGAVLAEARFIRESRNRLQGMDLLLIAGSNQFLDNFGGVWGFPYAMLKWSWLGRRCGAKVAFVSVGAGPLSSPVSRLFVRLAMRFANDVSFRDEASRELATCTWSGQDARVSPDLAFSLTVPTATIGVVEQGKPCIGLNPMPVHDRRYWYEANDEAYAAYVEQLARFCGFLQQAGYPWYFYATQSKDANVMEDVAQRLRQQGWDAQALDARMFVPQTVDELVARIAGTDILVATRFHGVVLSLLAGRPVLGVCYHRKTSDVMDKAGLGGFHMHIDSLDADALSAMLDELVAHRQQVQEMVRGQAMQYRAVLDAQYERLLDLVPDVRWRGVAQATRNATSDTPA